MATYKVIQDVEAEDKILGPLTLRQFIYAGIAAVCLYFCYFLATHGAAFMVAVFLPVALVATFFAIPWSKDQPTEVWALARLRFMFKPRRRIWNQSGVKELVTITAPKKTEINYTDGLSQTEVKSRLHALADTLDSRGWAVKNSAVNLYTQPALVMSEPDSQDRLINISDMSQPQTPIDIHDSDDMLDEQNNAAAQQMDNMIAASAKAHRQKIIESLNKPTPPPAAKPAAPQQQGQQGTNNYWFLNQPAQAATVPEDMVTFNTQVVTPNMGEAGQQPSTPVPQGPPVNEDELVHELEARKRELPMTAYYGHLHTIQPLSAQQQAAQQAQAAALQATDNTAAQAQQNNQPQAVQSGIQTTGQQAVTNSTAQQGAQDSQDNNAQAPAGSMPLPEPQTELPEFDMYAPANPPQGSPLPADQPMYDPFDKYKATYASTPATPQFPAYQPDEPVADQPMQKPAEPAEPPVTPAQQAAILQLSHNDDLNISTLAREAQRSEAADGEVVIKLH